MLEFFFITTNIFELMNKESNVELLHISPSMILNLFSIKTFKNRNKNIKMINAKRKKNSRCTLPMCSECLLSRSVLRWHFALDLTVQLYGTIFFCTPAHQCSREIVFFLFFFPFYITLWNLLTCFVYKPQINSFHKYHQLFMYFFPVCFNFILFHFLCIIVKKCFYWKAERQVDRLVKNMQ